VSRVAEEMNVTQPAISKQLGEIERSLKTPITQRKGNRIVFTSIGLRLANYACEVMQLIEKAEFDIDSLHRGLGGRVVVGIASSLSPTLLPEAIKRLKDTAPSAVVSIIEGHFNELLPLLESGGLDILIVRTWEPFFREGIEQLSLLNEQIHLVVGTSHPLAARADGSWQDLVAWPWIAPAEGSLARRAVDSQLASEGLELPAGYIESTSIMLNIELMRIAPFISLMPERLAEAHVRKGELSILPLHVEGLRTEVRCYWRADSTNETCNLFRECLQQVSI